MKFFKSLYILPMMLLFVSAGIAQDPMDPDLAWDNWLIMGNKIVFGGKSDFKHSHEIQWRADNNLQSLNTLLYEAVLTYSPNATWEIVPDLRYSIKPTHRELRPGFGIIRKDYIRKNKSGITQLSQQVKYQADIKSEGGLTQAVRYVPSLSHIINKKYAVGGLVAVVYQWGKGYDPKVAFIRAGPSFGLVFDEVHSLNVVPAFGAENFGSGRWAFSFTPIVQLIIRVQKDYKYLPARYINF